MPLYRYEIRTKDGKKLSSISEVSNKEILVDRLQKEGNIVLSVEAAKGLEIVKFKHRFSHSGVRGSDLVIFSRQLAVMLEAGVTLSKGLEAILKQTDSKIFFKILSQVKRNVESGSTFAQGLDKFPKYFSNLWVSMVQTGEASGRLNFVLSRLARYLEIKLAFRSAILTSLFYPAILLVVLVGALTFFGLVIIPTLSDLFKQFSIELMPITKFTIGTFNFFRQRFLFVIAGLCLMVIIFWQANKIRKINAQLWRILFRTPLLGRLLKVIVTERFVSQMGILVESGVPMLYSLDISQKSIGNPILADIIGAIKSSVQSGSSLSVPMEKSGFFAPMVIQMVSAGEESGNLSMMLNKISDFYEEYTRTFLERFSRLFEPIMIVVMGVLIGGLVISMYLPIFQIATLGGGMAR